MLAAAARQLEKNRLPVRSREERSKLILESMPLVYAIARRMQGRVGNLASFDDLVSAGTVGLISAIDNFDASYMVNLSTFAGHRIRGAILDTVRAEDWAPRNYRARLRKLQNALSQAQQKKLRADVSEEDIAAELDVPVETYREWLTSVPVTNVVSFEESDDPESRVENGPVAAESEQPYTIAERSEIEDLLKSAITRIPETEQIVLKLFYEEGLSPADIGRVMNLPAVRIYQLKAQAIIRLRNSLQRRILRRPANGRNKRG